MAIQTQQIPIGGKLTSTQPQQLSTKELSALYDRIYDIADKLFKKYNPCNIQIVDSRVVCKSRKTSTKYGLCCGGCKHISKEGCTIKCLSCKLFICDRFYYDYDKHGRSIPNKKYKIFVNRLKRLTNIAAKHGIRSHIYFRTKDEVLKISRGAETW